MINLKRNFYLLLALSFLACGALLWDAYNANHRAKQKELRIKALTDTVFLFKTREGKNAASIRILQGTKNELKEILKTRDENLAKYVQAGVHSVTKLVTETLLDTVTLVDTIRLPTKNKPLYISDIVENKYYKSKIRIVGDTIHREFVSYNEFIFSSKDKHNGFLKPKSYVIEVINMNPYTTTKGLSSYEITPKNHTGLKISIGIAAGVGAFLLLK